MPRDEDDGDTKQIVVRLQKNIINRLEAHTQRLKDENPGMGVTRADAIRVLLVAALDGVEAMETTKTGKKTTT